nr:DSBA-like thioredoxin domain protein [uncultured bacterium]
MILRGIVSTVALIAAGTVCAQAPAGGAAGGQPLVEGRQYQVLNPAVPQSTPPGVVEVVEVFSYGCPACNQASPFVAKMRSKLPAKAKMVFVPASWNPSEAWPMFQRAYLTAQAMGVGEKMHEQVFDAVWRTGEIPLTDPSTGRLRPKPPTIEDAAKFYAAHAGVKAEDFVATSKSFAIETKVGQADKLVKAYRAESTPTFVVAGKYKVDSHSATDFEGMTKIVLALVDRELAGTGGNKK